jgi:hypothetical protein
MNKNINKSIDVTEALNEKITYLEEEIKSYKNDLKKVKGNIIIYKIKKILYILAIGFFGLLTLIVLSNIGENITSAVVTFVLGGLTYLFIYLKNNCSEPDEEKVSKLKK